jgi:hypothetical protein
LLSLLREFLPRSDTLFIPVIVKFPEGLSN